MMRILLQIALLIIVLVLGAAAQVGVDNLDLSFRPQVYMPLKLMVYIPFIIAFVNVIAWMRRGQ